MRLNRSELAVPGSRVDFFEKAAVGESDIIFLDLEDSVAIDEKKIARKNVIEAVNDIKENLKFTSSKLDMIMLPKVNTAKDILKIDKLVSKYEKKYKRSKRLGFEIIIETGLGLINIESVALASKRNEALHFGAADFAASIGARVTDIGGVNEKYGVLEKNKNNKRSFFINDMWHFALFKILLTAHSFGMRAVDCPYGDFSDSQGFEALAKSSYTMGFDGKMVIHPKQIDIANKVYSPTDKEIIEAKEILAQMKLAEKKGKGAVAFKGKLLDIVSIKQANNIVDMEKKILKGVNKK